MKRLVQRCGFIALLLVALTASISPVGAQSADTIGVYYIGSEDSIARAIALAAPYLVRVDQPDLAQVIVINNPLLTESVSQALEAFGTEVQQGRLGMVIFCGPLFPQAPQDLRDILGVSTFGMDQQTGATEILPSRDDDALQKAIAWASAPELYARTVITNPNLLQSLVRAPDHGSVIQRVRGREGRRVTTQSQTLVVGPWFDHPTNQHWTQWAYFDYLIYRLIADAAGDPSVLAFVDYPHSPTPQRTGRLMIAGAGVGLVLGAALVYTTARRRLYLDADLTESWRRTTTLASGSDVLSGWRQVGFHRPLAGFLAYMPWHLVLFIPLMIYVLHLLPEFLATGTAGLSMWDEITRWTAAAWILLDAGTGVAAVRHFSARFDRSPEHALRFLQLYVWWQMLSGAVQVGLVCVVAALALPTTSMAHLTYPFLARAALQLPGFLGIFALAFRARQRFGSEQVLNLLALATVPIFQTVLILLLRQWTLGSPETTGNVVVVFGLAGGILLGEGFAFLAGAYLHLREGQALSALFLPTFDARTFSETMAFGVPWALAAAIPSLGALLQTWVASTPVGVALIPSDLGQGSWHALLLITTGFEVLLIGLYQDLMPALTEAAVLQTQTLLRYYVSQAARYGAWFSFFLLAALGALGTSIFPEKFAQQYGNMEAWVIPMLTWGALRWTVWLPDRMLEAAGRPSIIIRLTLIEQIVRIGGALLLTPRWSTAGLVAAYVAALLVRAALGAKTARQKLVRGRFYIQQSLVAPAIAALPIYFLLRGIQTLRLDSAAGATLPVTIVLLLLSVPIYTFLTALLGGWDQGSLADLQKATKISGAGYPLAWLMLQAVRLGAAISPLHGRYPVGLHAQAHEEALAVTAIAEHDKDFT